MRTQTPTAQQSDHGAALILGSVLAQVTELIARSDFSRFFWAGMLAGCDVSCLRSVARHESGRRRAL